MKKRAELRRAAAGLWLLMSACVPTRPPAPAVDPLGAPITTAQIQSARKDTWRTVDALALGVVGGVAGMLIGGAIGYHIDYPNDIQHGCEDCGLDGALNGALIGMIAGITVGGNVGLKLGAEADRNDAIRRIIRERMARVPALPPACGAPPRIACPAF